MPDDPESVIEIDPAALVAGTLRALVEEFVTRRGTDYGARERSLDEKVSDVMRQLERGQLRIVFDPETEAANIVEAA